MIPNVPMADYVRDAFDVGDGIRTPSLSSSIANLLLTRSPAHAAYSHARLNPAWRSDDESRFDLGSAVHAVLLEGDRDIIATIDAADWRTKAAKEARDAARAAGKIPVLAHHMAKVEKMVKAAHVKLAASPDLRGVPLDALHAERTALWQEGDIWCRCRPDWTTPDYTVVLSVKTTEASAEPESFTRLLLGSGYDLQAAFELRGVEAMTGTRPRHYIWIVCETEPPYAVSLLGLAPALADLGQAKYREAVARWADCIAQDHFPAYPDRVCYVDPPEWAMARWMERAPGSVVPVSPVDDGRPLEEQLFGDAR